MKPVINKTKFGSITVNGKKYRHDICIAIDGTVSKRNKKLSKSIYGSSHTISLDEVQSFYENGADGLIIGTGQFDLVNLANDSAEFLRNKNCRVYLLPTAKAVDKWNSGGGKWLGLFHVTC
jgi:hypothetical protein